MRALSKTLLSGIALVSNVDEWTRNLLSDEKLLCDFDVGRGGCVFRRFHCCIRLRASEMTRWDIINTRNDSVRRL